MGVMEARRRILLNQPHLVDASGNPIAFQTDMAAKMGVKAYFSPVQSGSGDPSPSNVRPISGWTGCNVTRCGKNLLNPDLWSTTNNKNYVNYATGQVVFQSNGYNSSDFVPVKSGATYQLHASMYGQASGGIAFYSDSNVSNYISGIQISSNTITDHTFTVPMAAKYMRFWNTTSIIPTSDVWLRLDGMTGNKEPYSGAEYPVTFPATGKNLLSKGIIPETSLSTFTFDKSQFVKAGTYTISFTSTSATNWRYYVRGFDSNGTVLGDGFMSGSGMSYRSDFQGYLSGQNITDTSRIITTNQDCCLAFGLLLGDVTASTTVTGAQLESGQTATAYEPFTNTIYGGYVDLERGVVVADKMLVKLNGSEAWQSNSAITNGYYYKEDRSVSTSTYILSDKYVSTQIPGNQMVAGQMKKASTNMNFCTTFATVEAWKEELAENNVKLVFELNNLIIYPLSSFTTPKTLKGQNTIWSDTNGNVSLKYWKH